MSTKDRILETAIDLFAQQGYAAVFIRDDTRAVGIKESSLYNHIRNKEELFETLLGLFRREFLESVARLGVESIGFDTADHLESTSYKYRKMIVC